MKSMNDAAHVIKSQALFDEFREIIEFLQTSFQEGRTAHQVEEGLWRRVLKLGRHAFGAWLGVPTKNPIHRNAHTKESAEENVSS